MNEFKRVSIYSLNDLGVHNLTNVLMCLVDADLHKSSNIEDGENVLLKVMCETTPENLESIFNLGVSFCVVDKCYRFYINRLSLFGADK